MNMRVSHAMEDSNFERRLTQVRVFLMISYIDCQADKFPKASYALSPCNNQRDTYNSAMLHGQVGIFSHWTCASFFSYISGSIAQQLGNTNEPRFILQLHLRQHCPIIGQHHWTKVHSSATSQAVLPNNWATPMNQGSFFSYISGSIAHPVHGSWTIEQLCY